MAFDPYKEVEEIRKSIQEKKKAKKKKESKVPLIFNISIDEETRLREVLAKVFERKPDPQAYAQLLLSNACSARKMDGTMWRNAPDDLYERIEILTGGIVPAEMLRSGSSPDAILSVAEKERSRRGRPKKRTMENIEIPEDLAKFQEKYGSLVKKEVKHFLNLFPKLNNPVDKSFVEQLVMVRLLMKEMLVKAAMQSGAKTYAQTMEKLANIERQLMDTLGISAKQRQQIIDKKKSGSIAELVEMAELYKDDYREVELRLFLEEIMVLIQRYRRGEISKHLFTVLMRIEPDEALSLLKEMDLVDEKGHFKPKALDRFKSLEDLEAKWKEYAKNRLQDKVRRL